MPTEQQIAQDLYNRLKPVAMKKPREYVMAHTPAYLTDEMVALIDADIPPTEVPTVVYAPMISQAAAVLTCTLGIWNGAPTARVYQWRVADIVVGTNASTYTRVAGDVGKIAVCNMVATNGIGSSLPVASNPITVT